MFCLSCRSAKQTKLTAEMLIHFPGLENVDKPVVWLFPRLLVCLDCCTSRFTVPETELVLIAKVVIDESDGTIALTKKNGT